MNTSGDLVLSADVQTGIQGAERGGREAMSKLGRGVMAVCFGLSGCGLVAGVGGELCRWQGWGNVSSGPWLGALFGVGMSFFLAMLFLAALVGCLDSGRVAGIRGGRYVVFERRDEPRVYWRRVALLALLFLITLGFMVAELFDLVE